MGTLLRRLRALHREEDGQSLVFGVMSIFLVLMCAAMVVGVGRVCARRIQMQFAADSASYSAALTDSECLNSIALLNTGMAQARARSLRYAADVNSYGVLAELRDRVLKMNGRLAKALREQISQLEDAVKSEGDSVQRDELKRQLSNLRALLNSLYENSEPTRPMLAVTDTRFWEQQLSALQQALTRETDAQQRTRLEQQVAYVERMLSGFHEDGDPGAPMLEEGTDPAWMQDIVGIDRADLRYSEAYGRAKDWIPAVNRWLEDMSRLEHTIAILAPLVSSEAAYRVATANGAEYVSVFPSSRWLPRDDAYLSLDVFHLGEGWWRMVGGDTTLEVETVPCTGCKECSRCGECLQCWEVHWTKGISEDGSYRLCQLTDRRWFVEDLAAGQTACIQQKEDVRVITWGPEGVKVVRHDEHSPPWLELVNSSGSWPQNTLLVRVVDGVVQQARYRWDPIQQKWLPPEESDFVALGPATVEVDGVKVGVTLDPDIQLPGSATIRVLKPPSVSLLDSSGQPWATAWLGDTTSFQATINSIAALVRGEEFRVDKHGQPLRREDADGRWRANFERDEEYWWQHRLTQVELAHWLYEYMEFGGRLQPETNVSRLLAHRDVERGALLGPELASDLLLPKWAYEGTSNPEGWLDPMSGRLVRAEQPGESEQSSEYDHTYNYYQVRPCWDPFDTNWGTTEPDGLWWFDYDGNGQVDAGESATCPTCDGKGYVLVQPSDVFGRLGNVVRGGDGPQLSRPRPEDYQETGFLDEHMPLVLSDEFFKYGVSVGVWHRRESHFPPAGERAPAGVAEIPERAVEYLLEDAYPGMKGMFSGAPGSARRRGEVMRPPWGYFAVAAARARLNRPGEARWSDAEGLQGGLYFDNVQSRQQWVADNVNNLYLNNYMGGWSHWDARLLALSRQVLDEDVLLGQSEQAESGVGWLMKNIAIGSPGGTTAIRRGEPGLAETHYGDVTGWVRNVYGDFDPTYPPEWVKRDLTESLRPRLPFPAMEPPYVQEGVLRDPFIEYLSRLQQGQGGRGGQLDYNLLDDDTLAH